MQLSHKSSGSAKDAESAAKRIRKASKLEPQLALVLGSGFQAASGKLEVGAAMAYTDLPGFPIPAVAGHAGKLLIGLLGHVPVYIFSGRTHFYEGGGMGAVTHAVRVMHACGVRDVVFTNAAGGINRRFRPGDFMLLADHINLMGTNPLMGAGSAGKTEFVDMTQAYDPELGRYLRKAARGSDVTLREGVYLAVPGPSYETPAEIRAFRRLGADAVGMSTVPEVIVARQCGLKVAAISCITNMAAGLGATYLSHGEVLETAARVGEQASRLLAAFAEIYGRSR